MSSWTADLARSIRAPQEIEVITRRADGTLRAGVTLWVVGQNDRVFVRSGHGRDAAWFRTALAGGTGCVVSDGWTHAVRFVPASAADLDSIDQGYRAKYANYASIVEHLCGDGPRAATLELLCDLG